MVSFEMANGHESPEASGLSRPLSFGSGSDRLRKHFVKRGRQPVLVPQFAQNLAPAVSRVPQPVQFFGA